MFKKNQKVIGLQKASMGNTLKKFHLSVKNNRLHIGFRLKNFPKVRIMIFHADFTEFGVNFVRPKVA